MEEMSTNVGPYVTEQHYAKPATLETARACVNCGRLYDYEEPYCPYCYCRNPTYKGEVKDV